jgi:pimeloyl-ACP methyl ester carboxylesterase
MPVPAYDVHGDGPPLVLLHSAGMAAPEWDKHVEPLAEDFRVIVPDLPGHGRTPPPEGGMSFRALGEAVLAVLDEEGIDDAHVLGSSMGGGVTQWLVGEAPDRLEHVVLFRVGHTRTDGVREASGMLGDPAYWEGQRMDTWLSRVHEPRGGEEAWRDVVRRVSEWLCRPDTATGTSLDDLRAYEDPAMLAVGDRDPVAPLDQVLEMHEAFPDSRLWVLPGADHAPATNTWRRGMFVAEVRRFLGASPGRPVP